LSIGAPSPEPQRSRRAAITGIVAVALLLLLAKLPSRPTGQTYSAERPSAPSASEQKREVVSQPQRKEKSLPPPSVAYTRGPEVVPYASAPCLALVIDDWGYNWDAAEAFLQVPASLTAAILPHLPQSQEYARRAAEAGFDVFVHLPLEPLGSYRVDAAGMITTKMSDTQIRSEVEAAIAAVPGAVGVNTHMGSKATADARVMQSVLGAVRDAGLIFVDSRTTSGSRGHQVAHEMGLATVENRLFIDGRANVPYIEERLLSAAHAAQRDGFAVAIGHVRPATVKALLGALPKIRRMGVRLVRVSELFERTTVAGAYPWASRSVQQSEPAPETELIESEAQGSLVAEDRDPPIPEESVEPEKKEELSEEESQEIADVERNVDEE